MTATTYGCFNRATFLPIVRMEKAGQVTEWPFAMANDCRYSLSDLGEKDDRCQGCQWKQKSDPRDQS